MKKAAELELELACRDGEKYRAERDQIKQESDENFDLLSGAQRKRIGTGDVEAF